MPSAGAPAAAARSRARSMSAPRRGWGSAGPSGMLSAKGVKFPSQREDSCLSDVVPVLVQEAHRLGERVAAERVAQLARAHDLDHRRLALVHLRVDRLL